MEVYEYKCIPLLLNLNLEETSQSNTAAAYEKILNETGKNGWKFVKIDTIISATKNNNTEINNELKSENISVKVFIFRKQITDSSSSVNLALNNHKIFCPSCQNEVSKDDLFCENCACKLK